MHDCGNDMHTAQWIQYSIWRRIFFINIPVLQNVAASPAANFMYNILTQPCSRSGLQPQSLQLLAPPRDDVAPRWLWRVDPYDKQNMWDTKFVKIMLWKCGYAQVKTDK